MMFSALISRWRTPRACTARAASAIWRAMSTRVLKSPQRRPGMAEARVSPSMYSITKNGLFAREIVENPDDIRVIDLAERARFGDEPPPRFFGSTPILEHLDGDEAVDFQIAREIYVTHSTRSKGPDHLVGTKLGGELGGDQRKDFAGGLINGGVIGCFTNNEAVAQLRGKCKRLIDYLVAQLVLLRSELHNRVRLLTWRK